MATSFDDIYEKFQSLITDTTQNKFTEEELGRIFLNYLKKSAHLDFVSCKKDLTDVDYTLKQFNEDLNEMEQWIIAYGMTTSWIEPQLKYNRIMRESYKGDSIKEDSHANLIAKLVNMLADTRMELSRYKSDYSYRDFSGFD